MRSREISREPLNSMDNVSWAKDLRDIRGITRKLRTGSFYATVARRWIPSLIMSKSKLSNYKYQGALASLSNSVKKVLDIDGRFIDDPIQACFWTFEAKL